MRLSITTTRRYGARWLLLASIIAVFGASWIKYAPYQFSRFATAEPTGNTAPLADPPVFQSRFASSEVDDFVHSPAVTYLSDGRLIAVWFAGSREGAKDVVIRSSIYDPDTEEWTPQGTLVSRQSTASAVHRYIRKLGNPVIATAPDGHLWLFYVSVSVGGWAGSAINAMHSEDNGETWSEPRRLITSPFLNISTLVRTAPVFYRDGSIGLPVYHEFLGKFAELLYLNEDGRVIDKFRITSGDFSLQPSIVPLGEKRAVALLRYAGDGPRHVMASETTDGGRSWSEPYRLAPRNPNSSLAALPAADRENNVLVVQNNLHADRFQLGLYETDSSLQSWKRLLVLDQSPDPEGKPIARAAFEEHLRSQFLDTGSPSQDRWFDSFLRSLDHRLCYRGNCEFQYEYPYIIRCPDGNFHVVYTWNNSFIKHVTFNRAWLGRKT